MTAGEDEIVYDLTEVFMSSVGKLQYYGIVRVVAEIAVQLRQIAPAVRYMIYSPGHRDFFEVFPEPDDTADGGVRLNVPIAAAPMRIREVHHTSSPVRAILLPAVRAVVGFINRRRWRRAGVALPRMALDGATVISAGRPKLMLTPLSVIGRRGIRIRFQPLLHDMIPLHDFGGHRRKMFSSNFLNDNRYVIERAERIFANSEFTRDDMLDWSRKGVLPALPPVLAIPLVHECRPGIEAPAKAPPDEPYILGVGTLTGRKNIEIAFNALLELHRRGRPVPMLILAGAVRHHTDEYLNRPDYAPIRDRVAQIGALNQTDLIRHYEQARALLLASRIEGWGLPAGEALWLGTPVLCSTAPVLREVCGDLALYFDPDDPTTLADHIDRLITDPSFRTALVTRIRAAHPKLRTWRTVAEDLLAAARQPLLR